MSTSFSESRPLFQSTLPARGATRVSGSSRPPPIFQSTLPARGATATDASYPYKLVFQSTLPARGATLRRGPDEADGSISIHAPREGSDAGSRRDQPGRRYFNPRSPRGERPFVTLTISKENLISIHAPREGSDRVRCRRQSSRPYFNPRSPRGERPVGVVQRLFFC